MEIEKKGKMKPTDAVMWRGRLAVFIKHAREKHKAIIRIAGNKSNYKVGIHELRHNKYLKKPFKLVKDDPLEILIKKSTTNLS